MQHLSISIISWFSLEPQEIFGSWFHQLSAPEAIWLALATLLQLAACGNHRRASRRCAHDLWTEMVWCFCMFLVAMTVGTWLWWLVNESDVGQSDFQCNMDFFIWLVSNICIFNFNYTGWWFWNNFFIFPYIGNHNPNWRTHVFQRGRYTTKQFFSLGYLWDDDPQWLVFCEIFSGAWLKHSSDQVYSGGAKYLQVGVPPLLPQETGTIHDRSKHAKWLLKMVAWVDWEIMGIWKYQYEYPLVMSK